MNRLSCLTVRRSAGGHIFLAFLAALCFSVMLHASVASALEAPRLKGYVNDYADMISPQLEMRLERALQSFDLTDSTQIAILTIDSLEGDALEDFSIRTVDQWKIGRKGKDNGVLLLAVKKERKLRIEVGWGLEGVLTDLMAGRIIDQVVSPRFKTGSFDAGFEAGVAAIIQVTRGEFKADKTYARHSRRKQGPPPIFTYLFMGALLIGFLGQVSKPLGMLSGAVLLPLVFLLGFSSPLGLLTLLFLVPAGAFGGLLLPLVFASSFSRRGGFYMGGGGFGGGLGGGGFGGFGGGGFGGGGASGGW